MGGYPDYKTVVFFLSFLCIYTTILALEKKNWKSIGIAVASYWLFAFTWNSSWYIYYFVVIFIPFYLLFLFIEALFRKEKIRMPEFFVEKLKENKSLILTIFYIGAIGYIVTVITGNWPFNTINPIDGLLR